MNDTPTGRAPVTEILDSLVTDLRPNPVSGADVVRRARRRTRVHRGVGVATAAASVVALAGLAGLVGPWAGGGTDDGRGDAVSVAGAAPGWRWITSRGLEVQVPVDWAVNVRCPQGPAVFRAQGVMPMVKCAAPPEGRAPASAVLDVLTDESGRLPDPEAGGTWSAWTPTRLADGTEALTATATQGDGRRVTALSVPARTTAITVTGADDAVTRHLIESVRVIRDRDVVGCEATSPGAPLALRDAATTRPVPAPSGVDSASVCLYEADGRLSASTRLDDRQIEELVGALRQAPAGVNPPPDLSAVSCKAGADASGVQVRFTTANGTTTALWIAYQLCVSRYGMSDGEGTSQVTENVLGAVLVPLRTGYSIDFTVG
ncbi:MAG: hypothetical protein U0Q15_04405 [Kineosporiaceae bacterium]